MPAIFLAQLILTRSIGLIHSIRQPQMGLFLAAMWFSLLVVEDALWFALNWYYPASWQDLLAGQIWWHTRWITLGSIKLPRFYLTTPVIALILLVASLRGGGILL